MTRFAFVGYGLGVEKPAGIHRNTLELLKELDKIVTSDSVEILVPSNERINCSFSHIRVVRIGHIYDKKNAFPLFIKASRFYWKNVTLPRYIKRNIDYSLDFLLTFPLSGSDILTIYDCIPERMKQYYSGFSKSIKRSYIISRQKRAIKRCKVLITDSHFAKNDISDFYGVDKNQIKVIYCAWQHFNSIVEDDSIIQRLELSDKQFFFSLGSRFPHKNIRWIVNVARSKPDYKFVVSGQKSSFSDLSFEGEYSDNIIFCGYLSDGEIKSLMRHCKAFIQPSLYEGFGIPPLEAMSVGADCIVSDIPVFREIYENSVWYIDPNDCKNVDIDGVLQSSKESNDYVLNKFSWEKSAKQLWEIINELKN